MFFFIVLIGPFYLKVTVMVSLLLERTNGICSREHIKYMLSKPTLIYPQIIQSTFSFLAI